LIDRNLRFHREFAQAAILADFDDSPFERVVFPRTNIALLDFGSMKNNTSSFVSIAGDSNSNLRLAAIESL